MNIFSTPDRTWNNRPAGTAAREDNVRRINEYRHTIVNFFPDGNPPPPPPPPPGNSFRLENRQVPGRCLDVLAGNPQMVGVFYCQTGNANQNWVIDAAGHIHWNANRNLCLGGNGNLGFVTLQPCSTDPRTLWRVSGENYINLSNNQLLNPLSNAAAGARVNLNPATGTDFQRWIRISP